MAVLAALLGLAVGGGLVLLWSEFTSPEPYLGREPQRRQPGEHPVTGSRSGNHFFFTLFFLPACP